MTETPENKPAPQPLPINANPADVDRLLGQLISVLANTPPPLPFVGRAGCLTHLIQAAQFNRLDLDAAPPDPAGDNP